MKERILNYITALNSREKNIMIFLVFFTIFFAIAGVTFFMNSIVDDKKKDLIEKEIMLGKIQAMKTDYQKELSKQETVLKRIKENTTNLNSYISSVKETVPVEIKSIKELKPDKKGEILIEKVEINIDKIDLRLLYSFLYSIENERQYIFVESVALKKRFDKMNYSVTAVIATLKEATEE